MYKNKRIYQIDRRFFLKGLGQTVIALPLFDFFLDDNGLAYAQSGSPLAKRFLVVRNGNSMSVDGDGTKDLTGLQRNFLTPGGSFSSNYTLGPGIQSLSNYPNLRPYLGFYSRCEVPNADVPGGWTGDFHGSMHYPQMTGRRIRSRDNRSRGASADQLLKAALDPNGKFRHINFCGQPIQYLGTDTWKQVVQFRADGGGEVPVVSPRTAFNNFFSNFTGGGGSTGSQPDPVQQLALEKRKSILDLVDQDRLNFLNRNLSSKEKAILSSHLDYIREIEKRIEQIEPPPAMMTNACQKPSDPGSDPAVGGAYIGGQKNSTPTNGYSNEDKRFDVFIDLIAMAFICDISRYGTFRLTWEQSFMNGYNVNNVNCDIHELTHYGFGRCQNACQNEYAAIVNWLTGKYFKLAEALRKAPEGAGNVLDNTALIYTAEGGGAAHGTNNMCTIVAGKAGGLKTGSHVNVNGAHPAKIILSAMKAVGYSGNSLGEISGTLPSVWG